MDRTEYEDGGNAAAVAKEWGVHVNLLEELDGQWEIQETTTSDDMVVGYYVQFDQDVEREKLDALGIPDGQHFRILSVNFNDQPEPEDPNEQYEYLAAEYKRLGGRFGAVQAGNQFLLNPWYPDTVDAEKFWRDNISDIPVEDRTMFLRALAQHGW